MEHVQDIFRMSGQQIMCSNLNFHAVLEWAECVCSSIKFFFCPLNSLNFRNRSESRTYVATIATQNGYVATIATQNDYVATLRDRSFNLCCYDTIFFTQIFGTKFDNCIVYAFSFCCSCSQLRYNDKDLKKGVSEKSIKLLKCRIWCTSGLITVSDG